jgi:hypothetical protein
MIEIIRFLMTYEVGINIILAVFIFINLFRVFDAWISHHKANFGLEKEVAAKKLRRSATVIGLLLLFGVSNFVLISVASIRIPGLSQLATPTIDLVNAAATSSPGDGMILDATQEILVQTQTAIAITGCIPGQLEWINPENGTEISGSIELKGTVNVPNMGFYKYEYRMQSDEFWIPISLGNRPVIEDLLGGQWNTEQLTPGTYNLRLVVSDNQNNLLKPCVIEVKVLPQ